MICADCGVEVEQRRGYWAENRGGGHSRFTCRTVIEGDKLISADYHYVEGEEQRHWRLGE